MYKTITSLGAIAALAATATAHGIVKTVTIEGASSQGFSLDYYYAKQDGGKVPEHMGWYAENLDSGFVEPNSFGKADIICHINGSPEGSSDTMAKVAAGGTIDFNWNTWAASHIGPVITYVAPYTGEIASVKKEELKWTKIEGVGYENGEWAAIKMIAQNNTWTTTVPKNLAAGKYVFRHEIIALHGANTPNGAQAYPQCLNIEVTGSGTETPAGGVVGTELYTATDPGILFDPYKGTIDYTVPGPALFGSGGSSTPSTPSKPSTPSAAPSSSSSPSGDAPSTPATNPSSGNAPSTPASPAAEEQPAASPSAPSTGGDALPKSYTVDTFISWLEGKASGSSSRARRHARSFF